LFAIGKSFYLPPMIAAAVRVVETVWMSGIGAARGNAQTLL
jgi:hypothetical protein